MQYSNPELRSTIMFAGFWNDRGARRTAARRPKRGAAEWRRTWLEGAFAHADNPIDRMLWLDNHTYLPG